MSDIKEDTRRIMDDFVTLRLLMSLAVPGIGIYGALLGVLWAEIRDNTDRLDAVPAQISQALSKESTFHTEQRVRIWNRINEEEAARQRTDKDVAEMSGRVEALVRELDRIIKRLDTLNDRAMGVQ